jgi:hypothetical protein
MFLDARYDVDSDCAMIPMTAFEELIEEMKNKNCDKNIITQCDDFILLTNEVH